MQKLALLLAIYALASAQPFPTGVRGTVYDGSHIPLPNVQVTATNTKTHFATTITAAYTGQYEICCLEPGPYVLTVTSMDGFPPAKADVRSGEFTTTDLQIRR